MSSRGPRRGRRSPRVGVRLLAAFLVVFAASALRAAPEGLVGFCPIHAIGPQDITRDSDGSFWVTAFIGGTIYHFSADWREELGTLPTPFPKERFLTGIAFNSRDGTLLVTEAQGSAIIEIERDGTPTGRRIEIAFQPIANELGFPTARGLAYYAEGDDGNGSIFLVESVGTLIYEIALDGRVLRTFPHPDDPDGFPGEGASAQAGGIDIILGEGGLLEGFYLTGARRGTPRITRLDADGTYTGIAIPIVAAGGNVSGIVRDAVPHPVTGDSIEAFVCVVESNARIALLEATEPEHRELIDVGCTVEDGKIVVSWTRRQVYDAIEVVEGCATLAMLPGDASEWRFAPEADGVYGIRLRSHWGASAMETSPCRVVLGPGRVLAAYEHPTEAAIDIARGEDGLIFVSDAFTHVIHAFEDDFAYIGDILLASGVAGEDEAVTGITRGPEPGTLFVYNTTRHSLALVDYAGEALALSDVALPILEEATEEGAEPYRGLVTAMAYDPRGDEGRGSLWIVEANDDVLHEITPAGELLESVPHPYRGAVPVPKDFPYGSYSRGVAIVPEAKSRRLWLTGGMLTDLGQVEIFQFDLDTRSILGATRVPLAGVRDFAGTSTASIEVRRPTSPDRLLVLPQLSGAEILEVDVAPSVLAGPTRLTTRQRSLARDVELAFTANAEYDRVVVTRDCTPLVELAGDTSTWIDRDVPPGVHEYAVRGERDDRVSSDARASLRVGAGAILERAFTWPARSPRQITRHPADGHFFLCVNWPGDERKVYEFDRNFRFLRVRESNVEAPWQISTLAVRSDDRGQANLYFIAWKQPVPIGDAGKEHFLLVSETIDGEFLDAVEIDPPRPTNGFVTFPTALAWHAGTDTFFYLERNSRHFVQISPAGETLNVFPHPAPPFQNFVFNLGIAIAEDGETLFATGAGDLDGRVTKTFEIGLDGTLTGREIPLGELPVSPLGLVFAGGDLVTIGTESGSFGRFYRVRTSNETPPGFVRGDVNADGRVDLTDGVRILDHLFRGGFPPECADAADADDSGRLDLTDAIAIFGRLFLGRPPLPEPYPDAGQDPTPDGLSCAGVPAG